MQWLIKKLGAKYIIDKTVDGATPLHMAAGSTLYTYTYQYRHDLRQFKAN